MPRQPLGRVITQSEKGEAQHHNVFPDAACAGGWMHLAELSLGCSVVSLKRELDGLTTPVHNYGMIGGHFKGCSEKR